MLLSLVEASDQNSKLPEAMTWLGMTVSLDWVIPGSRHLTKSDWPLAGNKTPDNDPLDQIGHGTHVAGIIGGATEK